MGILITSADFKTGDTLIASDAYTLINITSAISTYEKQLLIDLLGVELCALFILDLSAGIPQTPKYLAIYNTFTKQDDYCIYSSIGMKEMAKKWVKFFYTRMQPQSNTIEGNTVSPGTIATPSPMSFTSLVLDFNRMLLSYYAIQYFIEQNIIDYPTYKGIKKECVSWA
jgi:hypothetical protein